MNKRCVDAVDPEECQESVLRYEAKRRQGRKQKGLCTSCGSQPAIEGLTKCSRCLVRIKQWSKNNQDKRREARWNRLGIVGMTVRLYEKMLIEQDGHCYLCPTKPGKRWLAVDHNHSTGKPRRLLCQSCNTALERLENHNGWAKKAVAYLEAFSK